MLDGDRRTVAARHPRRQLESLMREAGKSLAGQFRTRVSAQPSLAGQLAAASEILNTEFGALTTVEQSTASWQFVDKAVHWRRSRVHIRPYVWQSKAC
jgi:hypothetical protein